mmetsp:Transcript_12073/g.20719  ORF Transcript_12073/g.20719 Transcript_12073/m.20719 type:complete len:213 (-) Transcript_12073:2461-3099(-)
MARAMCCSAEAAFCATPLMPQKLVSSIQRIICKKPTKLSSFFSVNSTELSFSSIACFPCIVIGTFNHRRSFCSIDIERPGSSSSRSSVSFFFAAVSWRETFVPKAVSSLERPMPPCLAQLKNTARKSSISCLENEMASSCFRLSSSLTLARWVFTSLTSCTSSQKVIIVFGLRTSGFTPASAASCRASSSWSRTSCRSALVLSFNPKSFSNS